MNNYSLFIINSSLFIHHYPIHHYPFTVYSPRLPGTFPELPATVRLKQYPLTTAADSDENRAASA
jgi:hypothetical protein